MNFIKKWMNMMKKDAKTDQATSFSQWGEKFKLAVFDKDGNHAHHSFGNLYDIEQTTNGDRLVIAPDDHQVDLIAKLTDQLTPPFYLLYVLLVSRLGYESGRYQSSLFETNEMLRAFLNQYREYIETDGRFHLWVGTLNQSGTLVFDHHNVIFAYGQTDKYVNVLKQEGSRKHKICIPSPHTHNYYPDNDKYEDIMSNDCDWKHFPLEEGDDY